MSEVVVHGQGQSQAGGAQASPEEAGLYLSSDEGYGEGVVPRGFTTQVSSARVRDPRPATPQAGPLLRCNNCGTLGHLPRACPNYGWYFPAPGKSREDYTEDRQRVMDLIAGDIIQEHDHGEVVEDDEIAFLGARPGPALKARALQLTCTRCKQEPGWRCLSVAGDYTEPHKARIDAARALDSPGTGG